MRKKILGIILVICLLSLNGAGFIYPEEYKTITIKEKWQKSTGESGQLYLVSDLNNNVYSVQDSLTRFQWDASDRYAKLEVGKTYKVLLYGWRIHFMSAYQNIVEIEGNA